MGVMCYVGGDVCLRVFLVSIVSCQVLVHVQIVCEVGHMVVVAIFN